MFNPDEFKRYFSNTAWLMLERITRVLTILLVTVYLARYLGPEQFGLLNYALSFVGLFSIFATFVADDILVRELVSHPKRENILLGTAFLLRSIGAVFALVTILLINSMIESGPREDVSRLLVILALAQGLQAVYVITPVFQARVQARVVVRANLIQLFIGSAIKLIFIAMQAPLIWFAWAIFLDNVLLAVALWLGYRSQDGFIHHWRNNWPLFRKLARNSIPLLLSGLVITVYMRIDQVMIGLLMNQTAVGYYAAAVRISEVWYFVPIVISTSLFPAILGAYKTDRALYYRQLDKIYKLLSGLSLLPALLILILHRHVIELVYGVEYAPAGMVLVIHIWTGIFVALGVASGKALIAENLNTRLFYRTLTGAVLNVLLNIIFIPYWGLEGAAWATLIAQMTAAFLYDAVDPRTTTMFKMKCRALIWPWPFPLR